MTKKATNETEAVEDKPHYAVRDFKDSGTEREFKKGKLPSDIEPGQLANYVAAGLATTTKPENPAS